MPLRHRHWRKKVFLPIFQQPFLLVLDDKIFFKKIHVMMMWKFFYFFDQHNCSWDLRWTFKGQTSVVFPVLPPQVYDMRLYGTDTGCVLEAFAWSLTPRLSLRFLLDEFLGQICGAPFVFDIHTDVLLGSNSGSVFNKRSFTASSSTAPRLSSPSPHMLLFSFSE